MSRLLDNLLVFGRVLRRAGIDVHPGRLLDVIDALGHVNLGARDEVYFACRALLVHRPEQIPVFDRAFDAFWRQSRHAASQQSSDAATIVEEVLSLSDLSASESPEAQDLHAPAPEERIKTWSNADVLAEKDFAVFTRDEIAHARVALSQLVWTPGHRRTRRWVRGRGQRIDL